MARGSVERTESGAWLLRWDAPKREDGRRHQKQQTFWGTKKAADTQLAKILTDLAKTPAEKNAEMPVRELCRLFLEERTGKNLRLSSASVYDNLFRLHFLPLCGDIPLGQVGRNDLQSVINNMLERGLAPKSVHSNYGYIKGLFNWAVEAEYLSESPVKGLTLPERPHKSCGRTLSADQALELLRLLEHTPAWLPAFLALHTGMRPGEVTGLSWDDVDLTKACLSVNRTMNERIKRLYLGPPKTKSSVRTIAISQQVVDVLAEFEKRKPSDCWILVNGRGGSVVPAEFRPVCAGADGHVFTVGYLGGQLRSKSRAAGLERFRLHDLRHTHASLLLLAAVPIHVVSQRLGHARIQTTLDLYGHLLPNSDPDAAATFSGLLQAAD